MRVTIIGLAALLLSVSTREVSGARFQGLGDFPEGRHFSIAWDISPDGSVVVGSGTRIDEDPTNAQEFNAFRWTSETGLQLLQTAQGEVPFSHAEGVSEDGTTIVGQFNKSRLASQYVQRAYRWTAQDGLVEIVNPFNNSNLDIAYDVSADGSVVVGRAVARIGTHAFRWTEVAGMELLMPGPGSGLEAYEGSRAYAVSDDGTTIVGRLVKGSEDQAFRWTEEEGFVGLGFLDDDVRDSIARGVSRDGSVVVGNARVGSSGNLGFRWTAEEGMVSIEGLVWDVSADGSVIVGGSGLVGGAAVWDDIHGVRGVANILSNEFGVDLTGWNLGSARSVSADGMIVVGTGTNPMGNTEAWIADLRPVAEPSSDALLFALLVCMSTMFHRCRLSHSGAARLTGLKCAQI